ncbi:MULTISPECIES: large-conductance mechanosensitive channel protein MscL [Clostridium]|uniref:Large-conductance mechanosensitive channel n=1 Tax=Clostridium cadaveris TaxID=1529 RepID=A0A1I2PST9_9CLOT|nr:large-conductance mechanosensitive channel protein MscL [Clostridium cadaveris]MDU4951170.1 large-conductance mechanosensitive channel protein MscL [Clostridium sp.]MDY4948880.1 large-conductance mechanosensitive channel protein MscL [Clostridium cadaveris]NME63125.1 large-conductance mechanosensitive channel protein MscL [Clostridium cadaveris]NWK10107.1 large-conductance mechanosensitive channel protein MscL [Clostridium cadaveris]PWL52207.1 MAG: large-conductance mechanosensitive channel
MKKFIEDFKAFALKGNVLDLAVGVVIGGAFNKIVSSLVNDIIMPVVGLLTGGVNFKEFTVVLVEATESSAAVTLNLGMFIQNIVDFLIISLSIFVFIKVITRFEKKRKEEVREVVEEKTPADIELLTEIRDLLKKESI